MLKRKGLDQKVLRRIIGYLKPYKYWVFLAFILVLTASFLGPLQPKLIQVAIDDFILSNNLEGIEVIFLFFLGAALLESFLGFANTYFTQWIGQKTIHDIRTEVYRHLQKQPLSFFDRTPIGRLISRTISDVESLSEILSAGVVLIMGDLFRLFFIAAFIFSLDWRLALVTLSVVPSMLWVTMWFKRSVLGEYRKIRFQVARMNSFLQEHILGMRIVQLFRREKVTMERFGKINDLHRSAYLRSIFFHSLFWPAVDIITNVAVGLILWVGGIRALIGGLTVGVLIAFIQYARQFFNPIRQLSVHFNTLQSAIAGAERIFDVLDNDYSIQKTAPPKPDGIEGLNGHIEFRNVWFSYDEEDPNWVLKDISFKIRPGEKVAIVGSSGGGKTTIINLLMRFYEIQKGQILIDGRDIGFYSIRYLRWHIGLVLQDTVLFTGTVEANISLNNPAITLEDVVAASKQIGAHEFIEKLSGGYQHILNDQGSTLSHGERELLSFVRMMVYDPDIIILDEPTSSIDTETEAILQHAFERLVGTRTSLTIAHRLSTIRDSDNILVIHKGVLVQQGTQEQLLDQAGLFRTLYEMQYLDEANSARRRWRENGSLADSPSRV